jgi:hypothetical protein
MDSRLEDFRKESSIFRFTVICYYVLTNLQFVLKFVCPFIIREGAFCSNKFENCVVVTVVTYITANQLRIPHHASYVWPALKKEIPLVLNFAVHFFLLKFTQSLIGQGHQSRF